MFEFRPGPVFASIVLGDELNRASPKTQSALLEAMAENQVTVDGTTYPLGPPFMVIATQNPVEHEGTYPLPESQLDRFLMKASVGYPDRASELEVLDTHGDAVALAHLSPVATAADVNGLIAAARTVHASPSIRGYLVDLADATRRHPHLALGMSPRATLSLLRVARSRAAVAGPGLRRPRRRQGARRARARPPPRGHPGGPAPGHQPGRRPARGAGHHPRAHGGRSGLSPC